MRSYKNHLSLIFALIGVLFSFEFIVGTNQMLQEQEDNLNKNYAIIAVAKTALSIEDLQGRIENVKSLEEIDPTFVIDSLRENISIENLAYLKTSLPKFYKISLERYPNAKMRQSLKDGLMKMDAITRVEAFSKSQNQVYSLLVMIKTMLVAMAAIIFVVSSLLMIRQMELWFLSNRERMNIMNIFGAGLWQKSASLFFLSIVDSITASLIVVLLYLVLINNAYFANIVDEIGIASVNFDVLHDGARLLALSLCLSIFCVLYVILKTDK